MPQFVTKLVKLAKPCSVLSLALILPLAVSTVPVRAQDFFGFFRAPSQPVASPPASQQFEYQPSPVIKRVRPKVRPRPKPVAVEQPEVRKPVEPKAAGEIANPVPALLADGTLRSGDLVMFPGGLRVFTGRKGSDHALADFEPLARSGKAVPAATRKMVAQLRPGLNSAWSADVLKASGKLALNMKGNETGGKAKRTSR